MSNYHTGHEYVVDTVVEVAYIGCIACEAVGECIDSFVE